MHQTPRAARAFSGGGETNAHSAAKRNLRKSEGSIPVGAQLRAAHWHTMVGVVAPAPEIVADRASSFSGSPTLVLGCQPPAAWYWLIMPAKLGTVLPGLGTAERGWAAPPAAVAPCQGH
jgi:hypothetical protein